MYLKNCVNGQLAITNDVKNSRFASNVTLVGLLSYTKVNTLFVNEWFSKTVPKLNFNAYLTKSAYLYPCNWAASLQLAHSALAEISLTTEK